MCRSTSQGGRRCPSCSDPEKRKAYNAIRRARYAANKNKKNSFGTTSTIEDLKTTLTSNSAGKISPPPTTSNLQTSPVETPVINDPVEEANSNKSSPKPSSKTLTQEETLSRFGLTTKAVEDPLAKLGYIKEQVLSGVLNYNEIDDNAHKELGFDGKDLLSKDHNQELNEKLFEISEDEVKPLTQEEKDSLMFFTSNNYEWFNNILYRQEPPSDYDEEQSSETVKTIVEQLDSAMTKAPKTQKIVYRGVSMYSNLFNEKGGAHQWIDENLTQGKEIVFDGYQSSTPDILSAKRYKGHEGGLIYEIMTPEGINVTSISHYSSEHEVILPRSSRYVVSGIQKTLDGGAVVQLIAINSKGEVLDGTNADVPEDISYIDSI